MRVLGIDPSLTSTGLARFDTETGKLEVHNVKSTGKKSDTLLDRTIRLNQIATKITTWGWFISADLVVIEAPSFGSRFGSPHDRSGLWWQIVKHYQGLNIPVAEVSPQGRAKYATGKGNSKKDVVMAHVLERYQDHAVDRIRNDDMADAVVLCDMGARHLGCPIVRDLPEDNLKAMEAVKWPA